MNDLTSNDLTMIDLTIKMIGLFGMFVAIMAFLNQKKASILNVYKQVFELVDNEEFRDAKKYVMDNDTFKETEKADCNTKAAEIVSRGYDKLGLLVREGHVPIQLISRFYAYPILNCWLKLSDYIQLTRTSKGILGREQRGHRWEFENLVNIIITGLNSNCDIWEGVMCHDDLSNIVKQIEEKRKMADYIYDEKYKPKDNLWKLKWYWV